MKKFKRQIKTHIGYQIFSATKQQTEETNEDQPVIESERIERERK